MLMIITLLHLLFHLLLLLLQEAEGEAPGGGTWGKAGPGGAYWRQSALTGQGFFAKMVKNSKKITYFFVLYEIFYL